MNQVKRQKESALKIIKTLQEKGFTAFFAGGCVRDKLLNRIPKDYDIATDAFPEDIESIFPKTIPIGKSFGVIAVVDHKEVIEVATFREEVGTLDGRHPETISFAAAQEDAFRRDFTINGLFYDPIAQQLHDYIGGQADLQQKVVRAIGDPEERFEEDHLRMLRAVRFTHTLQFDLDPATEQAIKKMATLITNVSMERIESEFSRTLIESAKPGDALRHFYELGLLQYIIPELIPLVGQEQPPQYHPEGDVFEHTVLMLNLMKEKAAADISENCSARELVYTLLLHDVGKPATATVGPGIDGQPRIRFDGHAAVSAQMAESILTRLKLPTKEKRAIIASIHGHMRFIDVQKMRKATLRKLIGAETFDLELELHRLDCLGSHAMLDNYQFLLDYIKATENEPMLPTPWITGQDLLQMGLREGKRIGQVLHQAYEAQMEHTFENKEQLLEWIKTENKL